MKVLLITDRMCDFSDLLFSCCKDLKQMTLKEAANTNPAILASYDSYCVLGFENALDARVHSVLEEQAKLGKHVFIEATGSFFGIYSAKAVDTTRNRLVYVDPEDGSGIPGLVTGDILDDHSNRMMNPYYVVAGYKPLLVYKRPIAHAHWNAARDEILSESQSGLWMIGDSIMMTSFHLHNFNRARFAPRSAWEKVVKHIVKWITGSEPKEMPAPLLHHLSEEDLSNPTVFETQRREAIDRGIAWLQQFVVDEGKGGVLEGLHHNIDPEGNQERAMSIRNDCSGEVAGAFKFYAHRYGNEKLRTIGDNIDSFTYGPMVIKDGLFDGLMRWTNEAWQVCYQDDVARCVLPALYDCVFLGNTDRFSDLCRALDFLVRTTAKDGCRVPRTDMCVMNADSFSALTQAEEGYRSAHYNAYYLGALLLAYKHSGDARYLEVGRRGLETLMAIYPNTVREQSETEEMCRLILPLAILYDVTKETEHREMLYRVVRDLQVHKDSSGGYREWDTGYKASCSRESTGECSLLTENGDPVVDLLYSVNWLPMGFAYAYYATGDEWFRDLWREVVGFCIRSQVISEDPILNGSWCRAFDLERKEIYSCPHDVGWAACSSETGWTVAEILMGMMFMDLIAK